MQRQIRPLRNGMGGDRQELAARDEGEDEEEEEGKALAPA